MKLTSTGALNKQSPAYQKILNKSVPHWSGDRAQTLAFYQRIVRNCRSDLQWRREDYRKHFDADVLERAMAALTALAEHIETRFD